MYLGLLRRGCPEPPSVAASVTPLGPGPGRRNQRLSGTTRKNHIPSSNPISRDEISFDSFLAFVLEV